MILTRPKMSYQQEKTKTFEIGSFDKLSSCGSFGFSHWKFIFISYIIQ